MKDLTDADFNAKLPLSIKASLREASSAYNAGCRDWVIVLIAGAFVAVTVLEFILYVLPTLPCSFCLTITASMMLQLSRKASNFTNEISILRALFAINLLTLFVTYDSSSQLLLRIISYSQLSIVAVIASWTVVSVNADNLRSHILAKAVEPTFQQMQTAKKLTHEVLDLLASASSETQGYAIVRVATAP